MFATVICVWHNGKGEGSRFLSQQARLAARNGLVACISPDIDMILLIPSGSQTWQWRIQHFRDAVSHEKKWLL